MGTSRSTSKEWPRERGMSIPRGTRPPPSASMPALMIVECLTTAYLPAYLGRTGTYWMYAVD